MDYRKFCLKQQTELRQLMESPDRFDEAIRLFFSQHAMLHSAKMSGTEPWSFEDALFDDMPEEQVRRIPPGGEHSAAWLLWHMARCEDITMNLLVAGMPQILLTDDWLDRMRITARDTGNAMDAGEIAAFSAQIDIKTLRAYRIAVGRRTREVVQSLSPPDLKQKVIPERLQQVWAQGALLEAARGIAEYWGKRDTAGLLLMPATRHNLSHLNEILDLKRKLRQTQT